MELSKQNSDLNDDGAQVIVEVSQLVNVEDMEILTLFFESRKQSDGGDILSIKLIDVNDEDDREANLSQKKSTLKIVFDDLEIKQRILKRKFFEFNNYLLRASENGYRNDAYPLDSKTIIIRNIDVIINSSEEGDSGKNLNSKEDLLIKLYAEHLQPDNDIIDIKQSKLFPKTFFVSYKDDFEKDKLLLRYSKKSMIRNQPVQLFDCFKTNSFIIKAASFNASLSDVELIKTKIVDQIVASNLKCKYFFDVNQNYIVFQFDLAVDQDQNSIFDEFCKSVQRFCDGNDLLVEKCHNFHLLKLKTEAEEPNKSKLNTNKNSSIRKFEDKAVQTDETYTKYAEIISNDFQQRKNELINSAKTRSLSINNSSANEFSSRENLNCLAAQSISSKRYSETDSVVSSASSDTNSSYIWVIPTDHCTKLEYYLDDIESQKNDSSILVLNSKKFYTIAFCNAKQILINIQQSLQKVVNKTLTLNINTDKSITIKNACKEKTADWKNKVMLEIKDFFIKRASYNQMKISNQFLNNSFLLEKFLHEVKELNRQTSALYFEFKNQTLHCYGTKNSLTKKIKEFPELLKKILQNNSNPAQSLTNAQNGAKLTSFSTWNINNEKKFDGIDKLNQIGELTALKIDVKVKSLLFDVISKSKHIYNDFKNRLKELNAELITSDSKCFIRCVSNTNEYPLEWTKKVNDLLEDYDKNQLKEKLISIPANLRKEKELADLKNHIKRFFEKNYSLKYEVRGNDVVKCIGYAKAVELFAKDVMAKFCNLENNIKDRIRRKLDLTITKKSNPVQFDVLNSFNGAYLKDFSVFLLKYEASIEKPKSDTFAIKCKANAKKTQNENYVIEWRKNLDDLINRYFSKFSSQNFKLTIKRSEINLSHIQIDANLLKINWKDDYCVELVGDKAEIDKVFKQIKPLNIINTATSTSTSKKENSARQAPSKLSNSSSVDTFASNLSSATSGSVKTKENNEFVTELNKNQNEETFLISDLKWFQTRILFEKKYFQYVTETFKDLSVLLDTQLTRMFFTGKKKQEIELAKKLAFDILDQIMGAEIECDEETLKKISANENNFSNVLKKNGLCCVVDTKSNSEKYTIYATTLEEIEACKNLLLQIKF